MTRLDFIDIQCAAFAAARAARQPSTDPQWETQFEDRDKANTLYWADRVKWDGMPPARLRSDLGLPPDPDDEIEDEEETA